MERIGRTVLELGCLPTFEIWMCSLIVMCSFMNQLVGLLNSSVLNTYFPCLLQSSAYIFWYWYFHCSSNSHYRKEWFQNVLFLTRCKMTFLVLPTLQDCWRLTERPLEKIFLSSAASLPASCRSSLPCGAELVPWGQRAWRSSSGYVSFSVFTK